MQMRRGIFIAMLASALQAQLAVRPRSTLSFSTDLFQKVVVFRTDGMVETKKKQADRSLEAVASGEPGRCYMPAASRSGSRGWM